MSVRVLIVDDHPLVRGGIIAALSRDSDITVVGEAADGNEALTRARDMKPDLILLDIALPGKNGLELLKDFQAEMPEIRILMLSGFPERQYAIRCLKSGAKGYITKDMASKELTTAIRKVMKGGKFISSSLAELLADELDADSRRLPHEVLSDREFQILCLIGQGNTVSGVADILSLSVSTVNTYRSRILSKMNLETTAQLIRYALDNNLSELKK